MKKKIIFLLMFLLSLFSYSQENDDSWNRDIEPPPAPIDQHLFWLGLLGVILSLIFIIHFKKKQIYEDSK